MTNRRTILAKLLLLFMGLAAGLVLCELGLRVAGIGYPLPYAPDPFCGTNSSICMGFPTPSWGLDIGMRLETGWPDN